jgi:hypothetical protein
MSFAVEAASIRCVVNNGIGETRILSPHPAVPYPKDRKFNELLQTSTYDIYRNKLQFY